MTDKLDQNFWQLHSAYHVLRKKLESDCAQSLYPVIKNEITMLIERMDKKSHTFKKHDGQGFLLTELRKLRKKHIMSIARGIAQKDSKQIENLLNDGFEEYIAREIIGEL